MDCQGYPRIAKDIHGCLGITMDIHGYPLEFSNLNAMDIHGCLWVCMDNNGYAGMSKDLHVYSWIPTDNHGGPWISVHVPGYPWIFLKLPRTMKDHIGGNCVSPSIMLGAFHVHPTDACALCVCRHHADRAHRHRLQTNSPSACLLILGYNR